MTEAASTASRVVIFRANSIDNDSRAKKIAATLARQGYDVTVLSVESAGTDTTPYWLDAVRVLPVVVTHSWRDVHRHHMAARRRPNWKFFDWTPRDEYRTRVLELRSAMRRTRRGAVQARAARGVRGWMTFGWLALVYLWQRTRYELRRVRWLSQAQLVRSYRHAWQLWDRWRMQCTWLATTRGMLPEVDDLATSLGPVLDQLEPDVIHAHHPKVLGTALRAARRRRAQGHFCAVVYDARENFAELPQQEQGHPRRHAVLVREEERYIRQADAVLTVSEPIAVELQQRYLLPVKPTVVHNAPRLNSSWLGDPTVLPQHEQAAPARLTVRNVAGLAPEVPLVVYGGALSKARGIDVIIPALVRLPQVHLAIVSTPFPHPLQESLLTLATRHHVRDRVHFCPPVPGDQVVLYLSGADVGIMPFRTDSANINQALPNKLFEYLHAGLVLVTSDAQLLTEFINQNDIGEVFADGDSDQCAQAIKRALARPKLEHHPRWRALVRRHSWQSQEPEIEKVYHEVMTRESAHL